MLKEEELSQVSGGGNSLLGMIVETSVKTIIDNVGRGLIFPTCSRIGNYIADKFERAFFGNPKEKEPSNKKSPAPQATPEAPAAPATLAA